MLDSCPRRDTIILDRQHYKMPPIRQAVSQRSLPQPWACFFFFFELWPFQPSEQDAKWNWAVITPLFFLNYKSPTSEWGSSPVKAGATCSGKLVPWVLYLRRISWSFISNSVSVPWNNMRLAVTESRLLCCQCRLQVSIHLSALINYTSQWQITPHSFVCSHMHANKRIRYQSKLIYSYEDGVPTVHSETNACTQWHQPAWQLSQYSSLPVTLFPSI